MAILLLAADATARFDGGTGRRKRRVGRSDPHRRGNSRIVQRSGSRDPNLIPERQPAYASPVAFERQAGNSFPVEISVGVLFENSIVCHVFYAIALGAAHGCVWFLGFVLFWFAWSSLLFFCCGGWVGLWSGFLGCCTDFGFWLAVVCGWLGLDLLVLFGEFDPGSGRTLAACLTHASRTVKRLLFGGCG